MASPQIENGFTKIANELLEEITKQSFSGYELRILLAIIRKTYGYTKKSDFIALSQLSIITGISKPHISITIKKLMNFNVITKLGNDLGINKDFSTWKVTKLGNSKKALNLLPKLVTPLPKLVTPLPKLVTPVTKLGNEKLPKSAPQKKKETITKETITKERKNYSSFEDLTNKDFEEISEHYQVPIAFVMSKYEDMILWHEQNPRRNKKSNWRSTLMNWVKRDAIKIRKEGNGRSNLTVITPDPAWK